LGACRHEDHGCRSTSGKIPELFERRRAVHDRHHDVKQNEIWQPVGCGDDFYRLCGAFHCAAFDVWI